MKIKVNKIEPLNETIPCSSTALQFINFIKNVYIYVFFNFFVFKTNSMKIIKTIKIAPLYHICLV